MANLFPPLVAYLYYTIHSGSSLVPLVRWMEVAFAELPLPFPVPRPLLSLASAVGLLITLFFTVLSPKRKNTSLSTLCLSLGLGFALLGVVAAAIVSLTLGEEGGDAPIALPADWVDSLTSFTTGASTISFLCYFLSDWTFFGLATALDSLLDFVPDRSQLDAIRFPLLVLAAFLDTYNLFKTLNNENLIERQSKEALEKQVTAKELELLEYERQAASMRDRAAFYMVRAQYILMIYIKFL